RERGFSTIWPTHGPPVRDVAEFMDAYISHRHAREDAILERLKAGDTRIPDMVSVIYKDVDKRLHPAACHSVMAHMIHLTETGQVQVDAEHGLKSEYRLAETV
ncbi:MAG: MBL fold metallo-hydrolase, partial [Pseudomonadota bacterium]